MMTPVARMIVVRSTPREGLVTAMTWLTMPALLGPLLGPALGGFLTTYASWHWIFLANLPIGLLGIAAGARLIPDLAAVPARPMDFIGFFEVGLATSGVVFGLSVISLPALPIWVGAGAVVIGTVMAAAYLRHARRIEHPVLELRLFRNASFRAAIAGGSLFRCATGATPFLLPLMFQLIFGLSPFQSGLLTLTSAIGALGTKTIVRRALRAFGFRGICMAAAICGGATIAAFALFRPDTPHLVIVMVMIATGTARSLFFTTSSTLIFAEVAEAEVSHAASISVVAQQLSVAIGVALAGGTLELVSMTRGGLDLPAFDIAFLLAGGLAVASSLFFLRLPAGLGNQNLGPRRRRGGQGLNPPGP